MKRGSTAMDVEGAAARVRRPFKIPRRIPRGLTPAQARGVKKIVQRQAELKFFYFNQAATAVSTTIVMTGLPFDVLQGTADTNRIGDALTWRGWIDLRYQWIIADTANLVRLMVVQWKAQSTGTPFPTYADVLLTGPSGGYDVFSQYNHDNRHNYVILFDRTHKLIGNSAAATTPNTSVSEVFRHVKVPLTKAKKVAQFIGGGSQGTNRLFLIYMSDSAAATHPTLTYTTKVCFADS